VLCAMSMLIGMQAGACTRMDAVAPAKILPWLTPETSKLENLPSQAATPPSDRHPPHSIPPDPRALQSSGIPASPDVRLPQKSNAISPGVSSPLNTEAEILRRHRRVYPDDRRVHTHTWMRPRPCRRQLHMCEHLLVSLDKFIIAGRAGGARI
jgi:hypothetical protein